MNVSLKERLIAASLAFTENTRVGNALQCLLINRYEGAMPSSPKRSFIPNFVRDARFDANSFNRWEMIRKIRDLSENLWLLQRLRDEFAKWTVGPNGLTVIPASSDDDWNKWMSDDYLTWCESPFLDSTLSASQGDQLMAFEFNIEGEVFEHFTALKEPGKQSVPAIQLIESHRVSSPGMEFSVREQQALVDGVQLAEDGAGNITKPIGYWVRDGFLGDKWVFRSTKDMHHVFMPERIGMFRSVTPYHAVINTLHDLFDLEEFEMQRARQNAEVAYWIKNAAGEGNAAQLIRDKFAGKTPQPNMSSTDKDADARLDMYRKIYGSRVAFLKTNEEVEQFDSKSPSTTTQWLWRYKIGQVCAASGVPLMLVFPELIETMQGTAVRAVLDNAHEFFRSRYFIFSRAARKRYLHYAQWARYNRPKLVDAPADWDVCHVTPPRAVNVDVGYTADAVIAKLLAGLTDYDTEAAAHGTTAEAIFRRKARQIALIKKIAEEESERTGYEVKPEEIVGALADILEKLSAAKASDATADAAGGGDEPAKKPTRKTEPVEA